jgi:HD superfamily phosphohydrolase
MLKLTNTPEFRRLSRIRQLGPAYLVYPGAVHSRLAHSFGVFHIARNMLTTFLNRGELGSTSLSGAISFLLAALLHDIGHFPYTHSLKELPLEEHESLTAALALSPSLSGLIREEGGDPEMVAAIVDDNRPADAEGLFFRKLLSGVLDPDKLDYLNRDAFFCGVPYGIQDVDFILSRIHADPERGMVIDSKGIISVEHLLFSKYLMYKSVYWHRDIRAATSMMKKALSLALERSGLAKADLYGLDDESFRARTQGLRADERSLAQAVFDGQIYPCRAEFPFDPGNPAHLALADMSSRLAIEDDIAAQATRKGAATSPAQVIVDLPEKISFETDLWVADAGKPFAACQTVFGRGVVEGFTGNLRIIRVFCAGELPQGIDAIERLRSAGG